MAKGQGTRSKKSRVEKGSIPAMIAMVASVFSFILWAIYVPFTFLDIASLICLVLILPLCLFLIIFGLVLSLIALKLGAGKRKATAVTALIFCILQVLLWVGWIIFGMLWATNYFD